MGRTSGKTRLRAGTRPQMTRGAKYRCTVGCQIRNRAAHLIMAGVLAVAIALLAVAPAQAAKDDQLAGYPIMNLSEPEGFSSSTNPLGTDANTPVLLVEDAELMRFSSWDNGESDGSSSITTYDTLTEQEASVESGAASSKTTDLRSDKAGIYGLNNVQAASFDPAGTGRRDHVAFVGLDSSGNVKVVAYNTVSEKWSSPLTLGTMSRFVKDGTNYYSMEGALSITAGDYDADLRDTLVVYAATDGGCSYVYELSVSSSTYSISITKEKTSTGFINPAYAASGLASSTDKSGRDILRGEVCTGDLNGDGIDDLAVLTQVGKCSKYQDDKYPYALFAPYLCTACGSTGGGSILGHIATESSISAYQRTDDAAHKYYDSLYSASMAIGDFDGEGYDTVVVAGRQLTIRDNGGDGLSDDWSLSGDFLSFAKVYANGEGAHSMSLQTGDVAQLRTNKLTDHCAKTGESDAPSISAVAVRFDGPGTTAYLVVDAAVYAWSGSTAPVLLSNFADKNDWGDYGDVSFVNSVAVGNFTGNSAGYEQLAFTLAEKNSSTQDDYDFRTVMIYASERDEDTHAATSFACTGTPEKFVDDRGDNRDEGANGLVVAIDNDDDGLIVKYDSKSYYYTDPEVLAVLQSAPYFQELYKNDAANLQNGGETSLTISETHGKVEGQESSQELEAGLELSIGGRFSPAKANIKDGFQGKWTKGWEESMSYKVSEAFMASTTDQVIVYRTPVYCYNYTVYNSETGEFDDSAVFYLKQKPTYIQMSLSEYERLVADYNATMEQKSKEWSQTHPDEEVPYAPLYSLSSLSMVGHEGDPSAYLVGGTTHGSKMSLSTAGGRASVEYEITSERTTYSENSVGQYIGAEVMSNFKRSPVNVGGEVRFSFDFTSTSKEVQGRSVSFRGEMGNLVSSTFVSQGYGPETYYSYGYDWQFCTFDTAIPGKTLAIGDECFNTVQVLGFRVSNLKAPPALPEFTCTNLVTTTEGDYFDLKWETPEGQGWRSRAASYLLYELDSAEYHLVAEIDGSLTNYSFRGLETGKKEYAFSIVAVDSQGNRSVRSAMGYGETSGGTSIIKATYQGIVKQDDTTMYAYEIFNNDGSSYPLYLVSAGESGGVKQDRDTFISLQSKGLVPAVIVDWNAWVDVIDKICKLNGHLNTSEVSYTWKLDECCELRTTACAICGITLTERHELHAHDFEETAVTGTCGMQGCTAYKCKKCGIEFRDNWTGFRHDYQEVEVPATCCSGGCIMEVCAGCGEYHVIQTDVTPVNPAAHSYVESEPACKLLDSDGDGKTDGHVYVACSVCAHCGDVKYGEVVEEIPHELVETYVKTVDASGTEWYTKTEFCRHCEYSKALAASQTKQQMFGSSGLWDEITEWWGSDLTFDTLGFTNKSTSLTPVTKTSAGVIATVDCKAGLSWQGGQLGGKKSTASITVFEDGTRWTLTKSYSANIYCYDTKYTYKDVAWWLICEECSGSDAPHLYLDSFYDAASGTDQHICLLCGHREAASAHVHDYTTVQVVETPAGAGGYVRKICTICGHSETTTAGYDDWSATDACEHAWVELRHSCTDATHVRRICTQCGKTDLVSKSKASGEVSVHQYDIEVVEPTCTTAGYTRKTCVRCGATEVYDERPVLGHEALAGADAVVTPTCQHGGYTDHVCARCGEHYTDTQRDQLSHEYTQEGLTTVAATCCSGEVTLNHCIYCGLAVQVGEQGGPDAGAHDYDVETYPLTCTTKGCFVYTCSHCGDMHTVYFEEDPSTGVTAAENTPTGHVEDKSVAARVVKPTETEPGYTLRRCAICGEDYQTDPTEPVGDVHESKTYSGVGAPSASLGQDGDIYIDLLSSTIYIKANGVWGVLKGDKKDPEVNIIVTQSRSVYLSFDSSKVPVEDQALIRGELGKAKVSGISDQMLLETEKAILAKSFPELWESVPMDSFLKDEKNKITMHVEIDVHVAASDLLDPDNPFIEYSFEAKVVSVVESPSFEAQTAEYRLTLQDFVDMGSEITVTLPVCGNFVVNQVRHINAESGENYEVFTRDGAARFAYDETNNTVVLTINHFSHIRLESNAGSAGGGGKAEAADTGDAKSGKVANTGDVAGAGILGAALLAIVAALVAVAARCRRA